MCLFFCHYCCINFFIITIIIIIIITLVVIIIIIILIIKYVVIITVITMTILRSYHNGNFKDAEAATARSEEAKAAADAAQVTDRETVKQTDASSSMRSC